jgi:diacylglycerol kinase (ATP)
MATINKNKGLRRLLLAAGYSIKGLRSAWCQEAAFRQELILTLVLLPIALWLDFSIMERLLLIAVLILVLVVELLNSAIEAAIDRVGPEFHELSGRAKDLGSAAVLLSLLLTAGVWGSLLWSHLAGSAR